MQSHMQRIQEAGIVGAGGAGFPTHAKLACAAKIIIANGAECEPLLRVDQQMMEYYAHQVVEGTRIAMKVTSAKQGVICLKAKYKQAVHNLEAVLKNCKHNISLLLVGNYYPAGDEQALVYEVTGRVVPVGGIPIQVGAVVLNVTTLVNIANAVQGKPVTHKYVTVTGAVGSPVTVKVPIGTPVRTLIEYAQGPVRQESYSLILGGPAMGKVTEDWDTPVTKTLGGVIILPSDHRLMQKKTAPLQNQIKLSRAVCCQCNLCTQMCPRNMLGLGTSPHKAMRALAYGNGDSLAPEQVVSCCECGICTYYACPMGLMPSRIMGALKGEMGKKKVPFENNVPFGVSGERVVENLPVSRFLTRLGLGSYDLPAPMELESLPVEQVWIALKQHIGAPCIPCVEAGQTVAEGECIGRMAEGQLGAHVHASISGVVVAIRDGVIVVKASGGNV